MTQQEAARRLSRFVELIQIAQGDHSRENRALLFDVLTSDGLVAGTRKRIERYAATAPDICVADPPARVQRLN